MKILLNLMAPIAWLLSPIAATAAEQSQLDAQIVEGRAIAEKYCSVCHAVGAEGTSPHPQAPLFRKLSRNYPLDALQEALAEGIAVGHPDMPQFEFEPAQADALIAYLRSIQVPARNVQGQ